MSRTSNCIKMLTLLKAHGVMKKEEIAKRLNCNVRNINVYRRELEEAGYVIEMQSGANGGYRLIHDALFPIVGLSKEEYYAIDSSLAYMQSHKDFMYQKPFREAMDKFMATTSMREKDENIYLQTNALALSAALSSYYEKIQYAKHEHLLVEMEYRGMRDKNFEMIRIHPYEILYDQGSYYTLAYSLKAKDYRNFKFSEERMRNVRYTNIHFYRDPQFKINDHIGVMGLVRDDIYSLDLTIFDEYALLVSEKIIGMHPNYEWIDERTLHVTTMMEGKMTTIQFLLSLGNHVIIHSPSSLKTELKEIVYKMQENLDK